MSESVGPLVTPAEGVLHFTGACARPKVSPFAYAYTSRSQKPLVYCSAYAAMARDLTGSFNGSSQATRRAWADYLNSFQDEDGLFRDPTFGLPDDLRGVKFAPNAGWDGGIAGWGWWHMTNHILCALDSLGAVAPRPIRLLEDFYSERIVLEEWLAARDWNIAWAVGNEVLNLGTFLLYARDFHNEDRAKPLIVRLFDWLDAHQDPATGFWGTDCRTRGGRLHAMCGAYHEYILYVYDDRPIPNLTAAVDATLALQNSDSGGFALDGTSGACEDIDAAFILSNSYLLLDYRRAEIERALARVLSVILEHQNPDGGFVYVRGKPYVYGHELMRSGVDESALFPSWFRLLSVALINQLIPHPKADPTPWKFNHAPYLHYFPLEKLTGLRAYKS